MIDHLTLSKVMIDPINFFPDEEAIWLPNGLNMVIFMVLT